MNFELTSEEQALMQTMKKFIDTLLERTIN